MGRTTERVDRDERLSALLTPPDANIEPVADVAGPDDHSRHVRDPLDATTDRPLPDPVRTKIATLRVKWTEASASGRNRRAARIRTRLVTLQRRHHLRTIKRIARAGRLPLARAGRAPVFDAPVLHHQPRGAWRIYPLDALHGIDLPDRALRIKAAWDAHPGSFDRYYLADEVPELSPSASERLVTPKLVRRAASLGTRATSVGGRALTAAAGAAAAAVTSSVRATAKAAPIPPDPCLIGVVSVDGEEGEWFVLDRWRH